MDYTCRTKTLQALVKSMEKNNLLLYHKFQRPEGQWNRKQKSDLIDSLLRKYPINPTYGIKENGVVSIIDGIQRLSCVRDYLSDKFALSKDMETVIVNGVEQNISGMKFSKLDDDVKDAILNSELQIFELTDCTEKDVREMFRRQNAGKPLNTKQLRIVNQTDEFSDAIYSLASNPFMIKITSPTQRKNGTDKDLIIQSLMLILSNSENDFTSFKTKDIDYFVKNHGEEALQKIETLGEAMNKLDASFEDIRIPSTTVPMMLYSAYRVIKDKKSFGKLVEIIINFLNGYDENEEYKRYVMSGTSASENVNGRLSYWKKLIKDL